MRSQLKKIFEAKVDVSDKSHPVFTLSQKYSFPLKNFEDFKKFDDSLVDSDVSKDQFRVIRSLGGNDLGAVLRTAWRYFMTDELLSQLTWKGQQLSTSKKPKDMPGLESYRLPSVIYNAIKEEGGLYSNVSLTELNKLSAEFVTKAGTRLAAKKKKVVD